MFAVIKTGGKQYLVKPGDKIKIEKIKQKEGEEVIFEEVLLYSDEKGTEIGKPFVKDAQVKAKVLEHGKNKKVIIFKYRPKKRYRKKQGHRQPYTLVEILSIEHKK